MKSPILETSASLEATWNRQRSAEELGRFVAGRLAALQALSNLDQDVDMVE